jgi:hypothetical protein
MKIPNGGTIQRRQRRHRSPRPGTLFLILLLAAAATVISFQFARQQPVSTLAYPATETGQAGLIKAQDNQAQDGQAALDRSSESWPLTSRSIRPVYRYSVVPGGVDSIAELRQAMDRDPVVAKHFSGFDFQRAHLVQVSEAQSMHVAYRLGDKVYWTRKKVALHPGETLISDGKIAARTRCGNRVAMAPMDPPAMLDPSEGELNKPLFSNDLITPQVELQAEPTPKSLAAPLPETANALQPTKKNRKRLLPLLFLPFAALPGGHSAHQPLAVAPEPGTLLLVSTGLAGVYWKSRRSRRKR